MISSEPYRLALLRLLFAFALIAGATSSPLAQQDAADASAEPAAESTAADAPAEEESGPEFAPELTSADTGIEEMTVRLVPLTKSDLEALAAEWLPIVKAKTEEVAETQVKILSLPPEEAEDEREKLTELIAERKLLFASYTAVVDAWQKKGGDEAAIADYRAYRASIIVEETRSADFRTLLAQALSWAVDKDGGVELARDIAIIIAAIVALIFVARVVRAVLRRWIKRVPNLSSLLQVFIAGVIYWLVLAFGLMIVLSALGVDISPVFALVGGASFIIAFAFQDTLGNLAAGLMIMLNRPFDEGDYVDVGGVSGTVKAVTIVATTVTTPDNQVIVIPNKSVWGNVITNVTVSDTRRVDLVFGISYDDSIEDAMRVMEEAVAAHPLVLEDPAPNVRVTELGADSVNFICRPWVKTDDYWTVFWDLQRTMKERFDDAGISIPYPQRDFHIKGDVAALTAPAAVTAAAAVVAAEQANELPRKGRFAHDDGAEDGGEDGSDSN